MASRVGARQFGEARMQEQDRMHRPSIAIAPRNCTACNHNNGVPSDDVDGDHDEATCDHLKGMRGTGGLTTYYATFLLTSCDNASSRTYVSSRRIGT